jgi:2-succinyl-6-hydroxy-2,4-cyclohexadiene-1-carboxylate synthase
VLETAAGELVHERAQQEVGGEGAHRADGIVAGAVRAESHTVVMLHGFGGTRRCWDAVSAALPVGELEPLALDLPGHGEAAACPRPITFAACVERVLAESPERFVLCGYSMGGRIALQVALAAPERVQRMVLVSTSAGIADAAERRERRRADERLATRLEREPLEHFVERWRAQPVFAGDPAWVRELAASEQRRNRPEALAAALRGLGTGRMEPLWERLDRLAMPCAVLAGDRDARYLALGRRLAAGLPAGELIVVPGGHGLPWERPGAVAAAIARGRTRAGAAAEAGA